MTDHQLQEQLLNAEVSAPAGVWEKINAVIDEDAEDVLIQNKLFTSTVQAPETIWASIESELNWQQQDETVATSLATKELEPPAFIWENLETSLNENTEQLLAEKLVNAEVEAPGTAWAVIEEALHPKAKVIPLNKRFAPVYRYAAAAVVIGLIAWGAFQLFYQPAQDIAVVPPTVETPVTTNDTNTQSSVTIASVDPSTTTADESSNLIAYIPPKQRTSRLRTTEEVMSHENPKTTSTDFSETNYLLVVDDKGDLIRVSKKLSTMDCVKNSDVPVDAVTALQVKDCENKIKKLQQRLATSVLGGVLDPNALNTEADR